MATTQKYRSGRISRNPFFNFLREMRGRGMSVSMHPREFCAWGAQIWKELSEEKKVPYVNLAKRAPLQGFVRTGTLKRKFKNVSPKELQDKKVDSKEPSDRAEKSEIQPPKKKCKEEDEMDIKLRECRVPLIDIGCLPIQNQEGTTKKSQEELRKVDSPNQKFVTQEDPKEVALIEEDPDWNLQLEQIDAAVQDDVPVDGSYAQNQVIQVEEAFTQATKEDLNESSLIGKYPGQKLQNEQIDVEGPEEVPMECTDAQDRAIIQLEELSTQANNQDPEEVWLIEKDPDQNLQHEQLDAEAWENLQVEGTDAQNQAIMQMEEASTQVTNEDPLEAPLSEKISDLNLQNEQSDVEAWEDLQVEGTDAQNQAIMQMEEASTQVTNEDPLEVPLSEKISDLNLLNEQIDAEGPEDVPVEDTDVQNRAIIQMDEAFTEATNEDPKEVSLIKKDPDQNLQHEQTDVEVWEDLQVEGTDAQNRAIIQMEEASTQVTNDDRMEVPMSEKNSDLNLQNEQIDAEGPEDVPVEGADVQNRAIHVEEVSSEEPQDVPLEVKDESSLIPLTQEEQAAFQAFKEEFIKVVMIEDENNQNLEDERMDTEELQNSPITPIDGQHKPIQEEKAATQAPQMELTEASAEIQDDLASQASHTITPAPESPSVLGPNNPSSQAPLDVPQVTSNNQPGEDTEEYELGLPLKSPDVVMQVPQELGCDEELESQGERAVQILQKQMEMLRELLSNGETSAESHQDVPQDDSSDDDLPLVDQNQMQNILSRLEDSE